MTTVFAIDLGNKQTKMTDGKNTYVYPSVLLPEKNIRSAFSLGAVEGMTEFKSSSENGAFYWGPAILEYGKDNLRDSLSADRRYFNRIFKQLCVFALAKLSNDYDLAHEGVLVVDRVVAGLPSADYENDENVNQVKKIFSGQHLVEIDGNPVTLKVKEVNVIPQSTGTLLDIVYKGFDAEKPEKSKITKAQLELRDLVQRGKIGIVDIGGGTVLLDMLVRGALSPQHRNQLNRGANSLYEAIANDIMKEHNVNADVHVVETMVREGMTTGHFIYKRSMNNKFEVTDIVTSEIREWTLEAVDNINSTFKSMGDIDILLVTGGGSEIVDKELMEEEFPEVPVKFVEGAETANVLGFWHQGRILESK